MTTVRQQATVRQQSSAPSSRLSMIGSVPAALRAVLAASVTLTVAVVLSVAAGGGTYAMLNSSRATGSAITVSAGTAAIEVSTPLTMPATPLYPGATVYGSAVITNSGDVPLSLRLTTLTGPVASTVFSQSLSVGVATASSAANCASGIVTSAWTTGTFAAPTAGTIGTPVAKQGGTQVLCVSLSLPVTTPAGAQGQTATGFSIVMDGIQA